MSARAVPRPPEPKKAKSKSYQEIYDSVSAGDWYKNRNLNLANRIRLSSGLTCTNMLDLIFQNIGRQWAPKGPEPKKTTPMMIEDFVTFLGVTRHAVNEVLSYLESRKMASISRRNNGSVVVTLHTEAWSSIKDDYETWKGKQPGPVLVVTENPTEESPENDESPAAPVVKGVVQITKKPERIAAGGKSRAYPIKTGVKDYELDLSESPIDIEMTAAVISGRFVVKCIAWPEKDVRSKQDAEQNKSTRYEGPSGSVDPVFAVSSTPGKRPTAPLPPVAAKQKSLDHPRAAELASIFDPLIFGHCKQTLSGDARFHLQACEAIGDTPHDDIVKVAVDRGARMLRPSHVPRLCQQIRHDWEVGRTMPARKKLPTKEEIDAIIEREKRELAEARRKNRRVS